MNARKNKQTAIWDNSSIGGVPLTFDAVRGVIGNGRTTASHH
ncbi:hypothetical protein [Paenibacillus sp. FSL H7-0331]|nr:hypothetical protein [Paenibacillus sp. FSL H7-0331]